MATFTYATFGGNKVELVVTREPRATAKQDHRCRQDGDYYPLVVLVNGQRHFQYDVDLRCVEAGSAWYLHGVHISGQPTYEPYVAVPNGVAGQVSKIVRQPGLGIEHAGEVCENRQDFVRTGRLVSDDVSPTWGDWLRANAVKGTI